MKMSIVCAVILGLFAVSEANAVGYLYDHFVDLYPTFGDNSTTVVNLISGPATVAMNRDATPGKQWIAESGGYLFKLTIEDAVTDLTIGDLVSRIEDLPEPYIRACKEVSDDGEQGIAIYVDLGGAAAHGGKDYINMLSYAGPLVIAHEAGHVLDQVATESDPTIPLQWQAAIVDDNVSVSSYGDGSWWEDLAEFSKLYAMCLDAGSEYLDELYSLSPERFDLWEMLLFPPVPGDIDAPTPNPATFASAPSADSGTAISMTATTGADASGPVNYYFAETSGNSGGDDSGWQRSSIYTDTGLSANTQYTYTVQMRDAWSNAGTASAAANATTNAPDTDAPTPNSATFASAPAAHSDTAISMTATTGTDPSGPVQYYFDETSGNPGGTDSGWQTSTSYTDTGLIASTMYTYSVTMRDSWVTPNEGTASDDASAITDPPRQVGTIVQTSFADLNLDGRVVLAAVNFYDPDRIVNGQRTVGVIQGVDFDDFSCATDDTGSPIALSAGAAGATLSTVFASGFGREYQPALFGTFLPGSLDNTEAENLANAGINFENSQTATLTFAFGGSYADTDVEIQMLGGGGWARTDRRGKLVMSVDSVEKGELVDRGTPDLLTFSATTDGSGNLVIGIVNDFHSFGTDDGQRQYTLLTGTTVTVGGSADTDAPTPDPATFASAPAADSDTAISMTATTGTDASGPVEYFFDETTGNPGGTDSGWQTSASYTDSGLDPSTLYTYTVQMRDSVPNIGTASAPSNATTQAADDTDGDGLLDSWETSFPGIVALTDLTGLKSGPGPGADTGDYDGDGTSDLDEFRLGLIPTDATSAFILDVSPGPADTVELSWPSQEGLQFEIYFTEDLSLALANWGKISITDGDGDGAPTHEWTDEDAASHPRRFYRVGLLP